MNLGGNTNWSKAAPLPSRRGTRGEVSQWLLEVPLEMCSQHPRGAASLPSPFPPPRGFPGITYPTQPRALNLHHRSHFWEPSSPPSARTSGPGPGASPTEQGPGVSLPGGPAQPVQVQNPSLNTRQVLAERRLSQRDLGLKPTESSSAS